MSATSASTREPPLLGRAAPELPDWYPEWAREMAELYFSGTTCMFVLHGNVHDLIRCPASGEGEKDSPDGEASGDRFVSLSEFLATQMFGSWDLVTAFDLGRGLRPLVGEDRSRLQEAMRYLTSVLGSPATWSRDPDKAMVLIERVIQRNLLESETESRKRIAFLLDYAQYLMPAGDLSTLARGQASRLVRMMGWAQNPYIKRVNMAFCLVADKLSEVNERLVQNPHVAAIDVPLPEIETRRRFIATSLDDGGSEGGDMTPEALTQLSSGLNLVSLNVVLSQARLGGGLESEDFGRLKKTMIERQCQGLVSFIEPHHKLDMVVGHTAAKERLRQDARWISEGELDASPMGYLLCGPVGTGKTFLAECYAGTIGIPCVKLRNFRSKYVGETEGNLEQVLTVLRSLGPVIVMVDEADAALGNRQASGDSGTSGRVFSMIASQMGDTRYRGRIIWMLLTCRPDILPIDLKRQGRCEVHMPLFYPQEKEEIADMFRVMGRKNKCRLAEDAVPEVTVERNLSGADIEGVVLAARRRTMADGRDTIERSDLEECLEQFIPSAQGLEKELQEGVAVLECTDRRFLTPAWRDHIAKPGGRAQLQERTVMLRQLIDE